MRGSGLVSTLLFSGCLLWLGGCGGDPIGRQAVSGTVLFKGQPLDQGAIQFIPMEQGPTESGTGIENGRYQIPRNKGLVPGTYKVSILSYDVKGSRVLDEVPGDTAVGQFKERIPAKYNVHTTLTAEVKKSGPNSFDFKID